MTDLHGANVRRARMLTLRGRASFHAGPGVALTLALGYGMEPRWSFRLAALALGSALGVIKSG
jgi:hypothetical protein